MRLSRILAAIGLLLAIVAIVVVFNRPRHDDQINKASEESAPVAQTQPSENREPKKESESEKNSSRVVASSTPQSTPSPNSNPSNEALLDVLEKYSGSRNWRFDIDDGRAFKMTGGQLKGVMAKSERNVAFLKDLQEALGFVEPATFTFETQSSSNFRIVEQKQILNLSDGTTLPVFEAKIRYIGDAQGNAFLIYNELRPVRMNFRWTMTLDDDETLSIARAHLGRSSDDYEFKLTGATYAFAHSDPHQKVTEVIARNGAFARRLLIGHETRTVVWDRPLTVQ